MIYLAIFTVALTCGLYHLFPSCPKSVSIEESPDKKKAKAEETVYRKPSRIKQYWGRIKRLLISLSFPIPLYIALNVLAFASGYLVGVLMFHSGLLPYAMSVVFLSFPEIFLNLLASKQLSRKLGFLETSMSLVTSTYHMNPDIIEAIEKSVGQMEYQEPFLAFLHDVKVLGISTKKALENMCFREPNSSFRAWIDILIMCQDNRNLKAGLPAVVEQMNELHKAQMEADTAMVTIWKDYIALVVMICCIPILLRIIFIELYKSLVTTLIGQFIMILMIVALLYSVRQAVKINTPIMME